MRRAIGLFVMLFTILGLCDLLSISVYAGTSDLAGLESGTTYLIRNVSTGNYLDVQGGTDKNGQNVIVYSYLGGNNQKWKLNRVSGYTYQFVSRLSSSRVMDVNSSNIDIWDNNYGSDQKFTLSRNTDGTYYIKNGLKYVTVIDGNKNVGLSTSSSYAKWSFDEVTRGDADIYGFNYKDGEFLLWDSIYDSTGSFSKFKSGFNSAGFNTYAFTNLTASTAFKYMKSDSVWVFRGHGYYTNEKEGVPMASIAFIGSDGKKHSGDNAAITANSSIMSGYAINDLEANALSSAKCIMYIGCGTAESYYDGTQSYNLVSATYKKGAHFVLGTTDSVYTSAATDWTINFSTRASTTGATISECLSYASYFIGGVSVGTAGDKNCRLNY